MSNSLQPHGLQPTRLLCPWNSPGKNTGVGSHSFLKGIFPTQGSTLGLLHCKRILYHLSHLERLVIKLNKGPTPGGQGEGSWVQHGPQVGGIQVKSSLGKLCFWPVGKPLRHLDGGCYEVSTQTGHFRYLIPKVFSCPAMGPIYWSVLLVSNYYTSLYRQQKGLQHDLILA